MKINAHVSAGGEAGVVAVFVDFDFDFFLGCDALLKYRDSSISKNSKEETDRIIPL